MSKAGKVKSERILDLLVIEGRKAYIFIISSSFQCFLRLEIAIQEAHSLRGQSILWVNRV